MRIIRPRDLDGVLDALASHPGATLLAGGTDLMVEVNLAARRPEVVIALRRVPELAEMDAGFLGAGVTFARLADAPYPALRQLARTVGSPQIRAMATVGGNVGTASPAGDLLPVLAASDAEVELASVTGRRQLRWDELFVGPKRTARRDDEVIVGIRFPDPDQLAESPQAFAKVGTRQAMVIATVNCCVVLPPGGRARMALGAVGPTVLRVPAAEALVDGQASATDLDAVEARVREGVAPITDHRGTEAYRRHAAGVLARRTLERCLP